MPLDWNRLEREFPMDRGEWIFLNHAGTSGVSSRCANAMISFWEEVRDVATARWPLLQGRVQKARETAGRFFHAHPEDIAFVSRTSEGINIVAQGLDWKPGDNLVLPSTEYPANVYPWMNLADRGVEIRWVREVENRYPPEKILEAVDQRTRAVSLSFVEFASGFRHDLVRIGKALRERNILFLVDGIQGAGVFPIDVREASIDALFCGVHKWIMGPTGIALFYTTPELRERLRVAYVGADSVANVLPYLEYDLALAPEARRYEYGMLNYAGILGLAAALELLEEVGLENIQARLWEYTGRMIAGLLERGCSVHSPRGEKEWSGILMITHPRLPAPELHKLLLREKIITVHRSEKLRISPHFHNTDDQLNRVLGVFSGI